MPRRVGNYEITFQGEPAPGGYVVYPRVYVHGQEVTREVLDEVLGQSRTFFDGLDRASAEERALERMEPTFKRWTSEGRHA